MTHLFKPSVLFTASFFVLASSRAQDKPQEPSVGFELSRVVVTAPAVGSLSSKALLTSVDTFGGDDLQASAVGSNWELFARLPGIQLTNFNQGNTSGKPAMRGFNGEGEVNAVKLLIDGVPSNSNDGAMPYIDLMTPLGLKAVTAVRGTNDARYGLHNIAGNLEMLTREGGNATEMRIGAGPWGKADVQLAVDREADGFTQNYAVGVRHADGWRDHAKADRTSLSGKWTYTPQGQDLRFGLALRAHRAEAEEPGYLTQAEAAANPRQSGSTSAFDGGERTLGQASFSIEGGRRSTLSWRTLVYLNRFKDERWVRFSLNVSQQERDSDETHRGFRAIVSWRPQVPGLADFALEGGVDTERQRNASRRYTTNERVRVALTRDQAWRFNTTGVFVQAVLKPMPTLKLVPGYRVDRIGGHFHDLRGGMQAPINDYGAIGQPKLSAVWTPVPAVSAYANWGRTFQVGIGEGSYKKGAADLSPSINDGTEIGFTLRMGTLADARVAAWRQTATDEVYRKPTGEAVNIGATRRRGVDLQLRLHPAQAVDAFATLALQEARITTPNSSALDTLGKEVDHTPRRLFNAGLDWQARPELKLSAWLQGQGSYWLERTNARTGKYGAYRTLNLGANWVVTSTLQVDVQLLNANNGRREYVWWDGNQTLHSPGEPRSMNVALRLSL